MFRFWSKIFVGACGLALAVVARAQVQSYNVTVAPSFNAIANHLNNGRNTLAEVLPSVPSGTRLYKWDPQRQAYTQPAQYSPFFGWSIPEPLVGTIEPGEGAFLEVASQFSLTFRGQAQQPHVRTDVVAGFNL